MSITLGSSSFQVACNLVQPIARILPEDDLFALVGRIEQALDEAINPPDFMNGATAARYVRRRFDIPLTVSCGPPYRRLGPQYIFARVDLDAWAQQRIASAPPVAAPQPRQINRDNRETNKAGPLPTGTGLQFCSPRSRKNNQDDDTY
jgi:hypothetical protein